MKKQLLHKQKAFKQLFGTYLFTPQLQKYDMKWESANKNAFILADMAQDWEEYQKFQKR